MRVKRGQNVEPSQTSGGAKSKHPRMGARARTSLRTMDYNAGALALSPEASAMAADASMAGRAGSMVTATRNQVHNPKVLSRITKSVDEIARSKSFRITKYGGRVFLVVAAGMDAYEIYAAEDRPAEIAEKAGAWGAATLASSAAGSLAAPLLAGGPIGWVAYGTIVSTAGILAYIAGSKAGEILYEAGSQIDFKSLDSDEQAGGPVDAPMMP